MKIYLRVTLYVCLVVAIVLAVASHIAKQPPHVSPGYSESSFVDDNPYYLKALGIALIIFLGHALLLRFAGRLTTHSARSLVLLLFLVVPLVLTLILVAFMIYNHQGANNFDSVGLLLIPPLFLLIYPGFIVYSLPSSWLATLPLLLHYLILSTFFLGQHGSPPIVTICFAYLPLAGYLFPWHRRLKDFWKPTRLPRLRAPQGGFTLIELLIVVAIVAIFTVTLTNLSSGTRQMLTRQADWRAATALAEEQLDLLRARGALPALGRHPVDPSLARHYPFAAQAEIEVRPGPGERLREVWVNVYLRGDGNDHDISLAAILPLGAQAEVKP